MTITAHGYYWIYSQFTAPRDKTGVGTFTALVAAQGRWSGPHDGSAELKTSVGSHAERAAYAAMRWKVEKSRAFYLFKQNAFPCEDCLDFFQRKPVDRYFIFVISADEGKYSLEHGFKGYQIDYPQILYIQGGGQAGRRWYPGHVTHWTTDASGSKSRVSALRSCNDPSIRRRDGTVKKPQTWPDFPSISDHL